MLKTALSDPKVIGAGVGVLGIGTGSYGWKTLDKQNRDVAWILTMKEIAEAENETIKDFLTKNHGAKWITEDEDYIVNAYLRADELEEIVKKIDFAYTGEEKDIFFDSKKFGGYSYTWTKESFIKDGWKNLSFDYSPILKAHCDRLLGTKMINLFPQKDPSEFVRHFEQIAGGLSWCVPVGEWYRNNQESVKSLKAKKAIGVLSKDVLDKKNGLSSPGWQWHWFNTPGGRNLWCRQNALSSTAKIDDKKWEEVCLISRETETIPITIKEFELSDRWVSSKSHLYKTKDPINSKWSFGNPKVSVTIEKSETEEVKVQKIAESTESETE